MEWLYEIVKSIAGFVMDNWKHSIKLLVAAYFITNGIALVSGVPLPNFTVSIPTAMWA